MLDVTEIVTLFAQPEALAALPSTEAGYGNPCRASHGRALALRDRAVRDKTGAYAVVDNVHACGCRS